ncbi:hypothetical protein [Nonomuraea sp. NPDC046570]|uniref:hypothetical protein n=1 Tax=Nonomuraea sp. NPDC046570 TaxID=3155255 RepID=UPI0033F7EE54
MRFFQCLETDAPRFAAWRYVVDDVAEELGEVLSLAAPVLLVTLALTVKRYGAGRPEVGLSAARWGFGVVTLADLLLVLEGLITPPRWNQDCLARLDLPEVDYLGAASAWIVSANVAIMIAGVVGTRVRPGLGFVAAVAAVAVVLGGVQVVESLPDSYEGPALAADGTPRYALLSSFGRNKTWSDGGSELYVLDLEAGDILDGVARPDQEFVEYTAVTRDRLPGHYLVAAATFASREPWSPRGRTSRIHRLTVDDQGRARVGEAVSGELAGVVLDIAVSVDGRVAYSRTTADRKGAYSSFAGVLEPEKEWPMHMPYQVHWTDGATLVFPSDTRSNSKVVKTSAGPRIEPGDEWMVTLDVGRGTTGRFPIDADVESDGLLGLLAGGRTIVADVYDEDPEVRPTVIVYDGKTAVGSVFTAPRGRIISFTLDATGDYLLVGQDNQNDVYAMPSKKDYELVRIDLRPLANTPTPAKGTRRDLGLPQRVVWQGMPPIAELAW